MLSLSTLMIVAFVMFVPTILFFTGAVIMILLLSIIALGVLLFFAPIIGLMTTLAFFFYWIIVFPLGLIGGLIMYFTNLTCIFEVD